MISRDTFFRGAIEKTMNSALDLDPRTALGWKLLGALSGTINLEDARLLIPDLMVVIWNYGNNPPDYDLVVKDADGGTLGTLTGNQVATLYLFDNSTSAGTWHFELRTWI